MSRAGFFFFNGDWNKKTRVLTLAARGAWADCLTYLDEAVPRGSLTRTITQWARLFSASEDETAAVLSELESTGVAEIQPSLSSVTFASRVTRGDTPVTVSSRRMIRERKSKESHALRQQRYREKRKGDGQDTGSLLNPSLNPSLLNQKNTHAQPDGFAEFWSAYPKKKSKGSAEKVWKRLKPNSELRATILRAVGRQRTSPDWLKQNGQFIPYPATWLNAKGWEDQGVTFSAPRPQPVTAPGATEPPPVSRERAKELLAQIDLHNAQNE